MGRKCAFYMAYFEIYVFLCKTKLLKKIAIKKIKLNAKKKKISVTLAH
jgi:hypothetical protein